MSSVRVSWYSSCASWNASKSHWASINRSGIVQSLFMLTARRNLFMDFVNAVLLCSRLIFKSSSILEPLELSRVRFLPWCCNRHIRFPHNFTTICLIKPPWTRIDCELLPLDSYMVCLGALDWMMLWIVSLALGPLDCGCAPLRIDGCWNKAPAVAVFASPYAVS